ncbi:MAG: hypothetical protein COV67_09445 [Nitrospinae bacterium CG11_big_fil_rev_8_21_14_0_20_56_8]|nr:MAG: hypothetical protein COV67_09445 [Nitrospinae bacterium CG11_big_fil_rev_8_21_14_0_20_56_8]
MLNKLLRVVPILFLGVGWTTPVFAEEMNLAPNEAVVCENASWLVTNLSEKDKAAIEFSIGPHAFIWEKSYTHVIPPKDFLSNGMARKSIIKNKGPATVQVNCQGKTLSPYKDEPKKTQEPPSAPR